MINVSNDFKKRMEESRDFKSYAEITFTDGEKITLDSSQFMASNSSLTDGAGVSSFPLGEAVEKIAQFGIINDEQQYADKDFLGAKIRLYIEYQLDEIDTSVGRNYLLDTKERSSVGTNRENQIGIQYDFSPSYEQNVNFYDKTVTISFDWEAIGNELSGSFRPQLKYWNGNSYSYVGLTPNQVYYEISASTNKGHFEYCYEIPTAAVYSPDHPWALQFRQNYFVGTLVIKNMKWELGEVATSWACAPEDIRTERIEKGTYTVITPETYGETVIITAYDDMYKADKDYTTALTFPQTAKSVLLDICDKCDISLVSTSFLHDDFIIQNKPTGTFREVIGQIAMIACGNARIDRRNYLQIMPYNFEWDYRENVAARVNLLANTNSGNPLAEPGTVETGTWTTGGDTSESTRTLIHIVDSPDIDLKNGWRIEYNAGRSASIRQQIPVEIGEKYTISCYARGTGIFHFQIGMGSHYDYHDNNLDTIWQKFHYTFTIDESHQMNGRTNIYFGSRNQIGSIVEICGMKLEEGDVATPWTPSPFDELNPYALLDEFTAPKIEYNDTVITGFKTVIKGETSEEDEEILQGTDENCVTIENPLIQGKEQQVLSYLYERLGNIPFRVFSGDAISNPLVEFMDLVKLKDRRGNFYNSFITDVVFQMPGYTNLKNSTPSMARSAITYSSNASKVEQRARQLVEQEKTARELAVERLSEALGNASGMYSTDVSQPDGSVIRYLHDKPTLEESKNIIKITSEAIGFSNDGKTYPYGITLNGETITRLLYAEGINADYINTGALTVKNEKGDIIFQVDMATKSVIISGDSVRIGGSTASEALENTLEVANQALDEARKASNITIILSNEYEGVPTDANGNYSGTLAVKTTVQTFYGNTDISTQCTYTQNISGITGNWDNGTRTYTVTALNADKGWVDITASYKNAISTFTVTKRFNVAKVKAGKQGTQGINLLPDSDRNSLTKVTAPYNRYFSSEANASYIECKFVTLSDPPQSGIKYAVEANVKTAIDFIRMLTWYSGGIIPLESGETYTLSCYARKKSGNASFRLQYGYSTYINKSFTPTAEWKRYSWTFIYDPAAIGAENVNGARIYMGGGGLDIGVVQSCGFKLEKGAPNETEWTPAPQDLKGEQGAKGDKGDTGAAGRTYFVEASADILKRGANNAVTPTTVTANAYYRDGTNATRVAYSGRWKVETSTNGTSFTTVSTSTANEASKSYSVGSLAENIVAVRFSLYAAGGTTNLLDIQTIPIVVDVDNLTHKQIFDLLTNGGKMQGIYEQNGNLYINASYLKSGTIEGVEIIADKGNINGFELGTWEDNGTHTGLRRTFQTGKNYTTFAIDSWEDSPYLMKFYASDAKGIPIEGEYYYAIGKDGTIDTVGDIYANNLYLRRDAKLLWSGAVYPLSSHTLKLAENVSEQLTGISVTFTPYLNGAAVENSGISFFVPKELITNAPNYYKAYFHCASDVFNAYKTLYINDFQIIGDDVNQERGTSLMDIKYKNNDYVLTSVYGV